MHEGDEDHGAVEDHVDNGEENQNEEAGSQADAQEDQEETENKEDVIYDVTDLRDLCIKIIIRMINRKLKFFFFLLKILSELTHSKGLIIQIILKLWE